MLWCAGGFKIVNFSFLFSICLVVMGVSVCGEILNIFPTRGWLYSLDQCSPELKIPRKEWAYWMAIRVNPENVCWRLKHCLRLQREYFNSIQIGLTIWESTRNLIISESMQRMISWHTQWGSGEMKICVKIVIPGQDIPECQVLEKTACFLSLGNGKASRLPSPCRKAEKCMYSVCVPSDPSTSL